MDPSIRKCECDKSCNIGQYLDNENCKYRKKLVEEWNESIDRNEMIHNVTLNNYEKVSNSCAIYMVL